MSEFNSNLAYFNDDTYSNFNPIKFEFFCDEDQHYFFLNNKNF